MKQNVEIETITHDNVLELSVDLSILIVGNAKTGKSTLLQNMIDHDIKDNLHLDFNKEFWEFTDSECEQYINAFKETYMKNCNIYVDEVHPKLKNALLEEYFKSKSTSNITNRLVVTFQSFDDIENLELINNFDLILLGKTSFNRNILTVDTNFEINEQIISISKQLTSGGFLLLPKTKKSSIFSIKRLLKIFNFKDLL